VGQYGGLSLLRGIFLVFVEIGFGFLDFMVTVLKEEG